MWATIPACLLRLFAPHLGLWSRLISPQDLQRLPAPSQPLQPNLTLPTSLLIPHDPTPAQPYTGPAATPAPAPLRLLRPLVPPLNRHRLVLRLLLPISYSHTSSYKYKLSCSYSSPTRTRTYFKNCFKNQTYYKNFLLVEEERHLENGYYSYVFGP